MPLTHLPCPVAKLMSSVTLSVGCSSWQGCSSRHDEGKLWPECLLEVKPQHLADLGGGGDELGLAISWRGLDS